MSAVKRPVAFILSSSNHGSMLVNRFDYNISQQGAYGVGFQILNASCFDAEEINIVQTLLLTRRDNFGDGVVAIDCGANIGAHTVEWAKTMFGWGEVIAFEAQERIYYALAGNITLNNCFNARAIFAAVGEQDGEIDVPMPDYFRPSSFGSLEIRKNNHNEFIGQEISYTPEHCNKVRMLAMDSLQLKRLDLIKIDIEGMEMEALRGAEKSIQQFRPKLLIEKIKSDENEIQQFLLKYDYKIFPAGINILAIHQDDPAINNIQTA